MIDDSQPRLISFIAKAFSILIVAAALVGVGFEDAAAAITYERLSLNDGGRLLVIKGEFEPSDDPMKLVAEYSQYQPSVIALTPMAEASSLQSRSDERSVRCRQTPFRSDRRSAPRHAPSHLSEA
ncbi:hypothetical protein [Rhizobium leguminosarum]|uniref:Uncharacterized protein n=1 Tax=Rhizobium leguminosarum TaxID=384 RepID=A0A2K9Z2T5_RHILE|nr:hypothetical protein [Rhizobium leguminosarum]AUW42554.1 hypothetical protein CUJ84_Chr002190 [Rhizobium leguminosarum]